MSYIVSFYYIIILIPITTLNIRSKSINILL